MMNKHTPQNLIKCVLLIGAAISVSVPLRADPPPASCNALTEVGNDLYLVHPDGSLAARYTSNGLPKESVVITPTGSAVAFIPKNASNTFAIADTTGQTVSHKANLGNDSTLTALSWDREDVLRLDGHYGKETSVFTFQRVLPNLALQDMGTQVTGAICVLTPQGNEVACLQGTDFVVNNAIAYSINAFANEPQLDNLVLALGGSAAVKGIPGLTVQVTSLGNGITLHVALPSGNWIESRVGPNGSVSVPINEDQTIGLFPTITVSGAVNVAVFSRPTGPFLNEALAWLPNYYKGRSVTEGVAVVENTEAGQSLTFLGEKPNQWQVLAQGSLNVSDSVSSMHFISTLPNNQPPPLYFETASMFGLVSVDLISDNSVLQIGPITTLLKTISTNITGKPVTAPILTWACQ
jgi:hypothetical protein